MKFLAVILTFLILSSSSSSSPMRISKRGQVRLCGRRLAETMNMVCQGHYYDPNVRRHVLTEAGGELYPEWYDRFQARLSGHRLPFPRFVRQEDEEGIVDQCCINTCTIEVLLSYCGRK